MFSKNRFVHDKKGKLTIQTLWEALVMLTYKINEWRHQSVWGIENYNQTNLTKSGIIQTITFFLYMIISAFIYHILNKKVRKSAIGFWGSLDPFKQQCTLIDAPYSIILVCVHVTPHYFCLMILLVVRIMVSGRESMWYILLRQISSPRTKLLAARC
jgi:hypothetical protein